MKQFLYPALFLAFATSATQSSPSKSEMQSSRLDNKEEHITQAFRSTRVSHFKGSTLWSTIVVSIENDVCTDVEALFVFGQPAEAITAALEESFISNACTSSSDGVHEQRDERSFAIFTLIFGRSLETGWTTGNDPSVRNSYKRNWQNLNGEIWASDAVDKLAEDCEGLCPASTIIAMMFAKANYFDAINRPMTANLWRYVAVSLSIDQENIRREAREVLRKHTYRLYQHSVQVGDFSSAKTAFKWVEDLNFRDDDYTKIKNHFTLWQQSFEDGISDVVVPLVKDTPFSLRHAVAVRGVSKPEFRLSITDGGLDFGFLACDEQWQVNLRVDRRSGWRIPETAQNCELLLFGEEGTQVQISEYAQGSLDDNGNLLPSDKVSSAY